MRRRGSRQRGARPARERQVLGAGTEGAPRDAARAVRQPRASNWQDVVAALVDEANVAGWEQRLAETSEKIERLGAGQPRRDRRVQASSPSARNTSTASSPTSPTRSRRSRTRSARSTARRKTRFQDTFDRVNAGLKDKFPRLFGGGHAYLELVGDDVLEAGVAIMARPPGKRNSSISQLSGGEKALTAVALVFSIFELNPGAVLPARRSRCAARREQRRPLLRHRPGDVRAGAVHLRHAQQDDDGARQPAARRDDERARRARAWWPSTSTRPCAWPRCARGSAHERAALDPAR